MHAAYFGSCTVDTVTTLIIACSFGFTIFVTVYMTASFSGQRPKFSIAHKSMFARMHATRAPKLQPACT
jgi:hypothetical protein